MGGVGWPVSLTIGSVFAIAVDAALVAAGTVPEGAAGG